MNRYETYDSTINSQLTSFVCGALVGAAAALLFAPMRGEEMRASIGDAARQGRNRLREYGEAGRDWAQGSADRAGEWTQGRMRQSGASGSGVTGAIDRTVDRTESAMNTGAGRVQDATDRTSSTFDRGLDDTRSTSTDVGQSSSDPFSTSRSKEQWS